MWAFKHHDDEHGGKTTDKRIGNYTRDNENTQQTHDTMERAEHFWGILNTNQNPTLTTLY